MPIFTLKTLQLSLNEHRLEKMVNSVGVRQISCIKLFGYDYDVRVRVGTVPRMRMLRENMAGGLRTLAGRVGSQVAHVMSP